MLSREELANEVFSLVRKDVRVILSDSAIWRAIARTDDNSLLEEYEKLKAK